MDGSNYIPNAADITDGKRLVKKMQRSRQIRKGRKRKNAFRSFMCFVMNIVLIALLVYSTDMPQWYLKEDVFSKPDGKTIEILNNSIVSTSKIMTALKTVEVPKVPIYMAKTDNLKKKLLEIREDLNLEEKHIFIDKETDLSFLKGFDYIVDCIDDIEAKVLLAKFAINNDISLIASMGTGNRLDPSKLIITRLDKTSGDPLAKKFRYLLRKENVDLKKINVVASLEEPLVSGQVVSSMAFVPNAAGLLMSSYVIKELLRRYKDEVR